MSDNAWADSLIAALKRENPAAARLAEFACLAVRVDAALLRRLRHRLVQDADPGVEADLWFSPLMSSQDASGCVLHDAVALRLRDRLATEDKAAIGSAVAAMREAHAHLPATIRLEEELTVLALLNEPDTADKIESVLQPALRTLAGVDEVGALEVARWAMHAVRRMPERVRSTQAAQVLVLGAALRLETPSIASGIADSAVGAETLSWVLPDQMRSERMRLGVSLFSNGIGFAVADGAEQAIELPKTNPAFVSVRWRDTGTEHRRLVAAAPGVFVEIAGRPDAIEIVTLAGESYSLTASPTVSETATASDTATAEVRPAAQQEDSSARFLESCILVEPLGSNAPPTIAFPVGDGVWVTAPLRIPFVGVVEGTQGDQFEVLNARDKGARIAVLRPLLHKAQQPLLAARPDAPTSVGVSGVIGFDGRQRPMFFSARVESTALVVEIAPPDLSGATLIGAPILVDGRLLGMIVEPFEPRQPNQRQVPSSGDADIGGFLGSYWRFVPVEVIDRATRSVAAATPTVEDGSVSACMRLGISSRGEQTAFTIESGLLVTNSHPYLGLAYPDELVGGAAALRVLNQRRQADARRNLAALQERYDVVQGPEGARSESLILRPKDGTLPGPPLVLLSRDDPEVADVYSRGAAVVVIAYDNGRFSPVNGQMRWNKSEDRLQISIPGDSALHGALLEWRGKFAGAPVLLHHKVLGMVVARDDRRSDPVLRLLEAWKIREALAQAGAWSGEEHPARGSSRARVFLSHSAQDLQLAREISAVLVQRGLPVILQVSQYSPDGSASQLNKRALEESDLVLLLVTYEASKSRFPSEEEWGVLRQHRKRVLPVVTDRSAFKALPPDLQSIRAFYLKGLHRNIGDLAEWVMRALQQDTQTTPPEALRDVAAQTRSDRQLGEKPPSADEVSRTTRRAKAKPKRVKTPAPPDRETVRRAQQKLSEAGHRVGFADGDLGPQTQKALMEFQLTQGIEPTGRLTQETLAALERVRGPVSKVSRNRPTAEKLRTPRPVQRPRLDPSPASDRAPSSSAPDRSAKRAKPKKKKRKFKTK